MSLLIHLSIICAGLSAHLPVITARIFATQMSSRTIETQYGKLRGTQVTLSKSTLPLIDTYKGLQFASLLQGELRFMPPTSTMEKWDGVRVAHSFRPVCPQRVPSVEELEAQMPKVKVEHFKRILPFLEKQQEECLNLNIYVPIVRDKSDASLLSVLVFVHGETFDLGSGNPYDGSVLAAYGHVIVVTINYRLGVLGFLSTGDSGATGNYALLDQIAALRWVQENIRSFGGNKDDVTLLGHGHGAVMVNLLMISPVTKGRNLFQRVILQSGSALSPWAMVTDPLAQTLRLADRLNCSARDSSIQSLLHCLKRLPFELLIGRTHSLGSLPGVASFGPTVDRRSVILNDVRSSLTEATSDFGNVSLLLGFTSEEAAAFFPDSIHSKGLTVEAMRAAVDSVVNTAYSHHRQAIGEVLMHQYRDWDGALDGPAVWHSLVDLQGDALYAVPAFEVGLHHAALGYARTFVYCFNFTGGRSDTTAKWAESVRRDGAWHGDDLTYLFAAPISDGIDPFGLFYTKTEKTFAETMIRFWMNFIKTGSPNDPTPTGQGLQQPPNARLKGRPTDTEPEWVEFDAERQEVMILDSRSHSRRQFRASRVALWLNLIPKIHRPDDPAAHCDEPASDVTVIANRSLHRVSSSRRPYCSTSLTPRFTTVHRGISTSSAGTGPTQRAPTVHPPPSASTAQRRHAAGEASAERRGLKMTQLGTPQPRGGVQGSHEPMQMGATPDQASARGGHATAGDQGLALVVVVGVGCLLLALNALLFLCVYRKKLWRWRERRKRRKTDLEAAEEKGELTERSYGLKGTEAGRAVANGPDGEKCSHYLTPIPSHHHLYCQMTSLQNSFNAPS